MRDGMLTGPNLYAIEQVARASGVRVTVAGGVSRLEDIEWLAGLEELGIDEVIVGKALYDGKISLVDARRSANGGRVDEGGREGV
jgi:phosphoribosylformimino-5-aminoimidazole carboxamide ribonucleotide (ProFAR) isomerase